MERARSVLVAYADDAPGRAAAAEAQLDDGSLTIMHKLVGAQAPERFGPGARSSEKDRAAVDALLQLAHDAAPGIERVDVRVTAGELAQELVIASKTAALIVLGLTTKHATTAAVFDTLPRELVRRSHCPVLLVPADSVEWRGAQIIDVTGRTFAG
jgi:nucleotide-binding universal stress UspA family protein